MRTTFYADKPLVIDGTKIDQGEEIGAIETDLSPAKFANGILAGHFTITKPGPRKNTTAAPQIQFGKAPDLSTRDGE